VNGEGFISDVLNEEQSVAQALSRGLYGLAGTTATPKCEAMSR
jgi:hypothetical protein